MNSRSRNGKCCSAWEKGRESDTKGVPESSDRESYSKKHQETEVIDDSEAKRERLGTF